MGREDVERGRAGAGPRWVGLCLQAVLPRRSGLEGDKLQTQFCTLVPPANPGPSGPSGFPGLAQALARAGDSRGFLLGPEADFILQGPGGHREGRSYESQRALLLFPIPPLPPTAGCLGEVSLIHISYFWAVWAEQRYLSSCTHPALCRTLRGLAGPPGAQSPAELLCTNPGLRARQKERSLQLWEGAPRFLEKARSELDPAGWKERACAPLCISTKLGSLFLPSLPGSGPASFRLISFNTPVKSLRSLRSYFPASHCCHLQIEGAAPCLCLRVLRGPF